MISNKLIPDLLVDGLPTTVKHRICSTVQGLRYTQQRRRRLYDCMQFLSLFDDEAANIVNIGRAVASCSYLAIRVCFA